MHYCFMTFYSLVVYLGQKVLNLSFACRIKLIKPNLFLKSIRQISTYKTNYSSL